VADTSEGALPATDEPLAFFSSIARGPWGEPSDITNRVATALVRLGAVALDVTTAPSDIAALAEALEAIAPGVAPASATRYRDEDRPQGRKVRPNATGKHPLAGRRTRSPRRLCWAATVTAPSGMSCTTSASKDSPGSFRVASLPRRLTSCSGKQLHCRAMAV